MPDIEFSIESLPEQAIQVLGELLGVGWDITALPTSADDPAAGTSFDARVQVTPPDSHSPHTELLIAARQSVTPRDVETHISQVRNILRHTFHPPTMLVVAPWIGTRAQKELRDRGIAYLDLTGNVSLSVSSPAIRLYTQGESRAPKASLGSFGVGAKTVTLRGPLAGRIVRYLVDVAPPYQAKQIAEATGVSLAWVSRLLGALDDQLLIRRAGRSITEVDWQGLLRARAQAYDLLQDNPYVGMIAVNGIPSVLNKLAIFPQPEYGRPRAVVTGPYAARAVAPLTAGGQLMLYVQDAPHSHGGDEHWGDELGLLRADDGADVLLLRAQDDVVFHRTRSVDGIAHVALSQLVLDGLAGPGRMPAEAEAVLTRMADTEQTWRHPRGAPVEPPTRR